MYRTIQQLNNCEQGIQQGYKFATTLCGSYHKYVFIMYFSLNS